MSYLDNLKPLADRDVASIQEKDREYGGSWKKRGGVGAFMMLARKWDRLEKQVEAQGYDVFKAIREDQRSEGVLDDIRDLRRYLLLVEAEWGTSPLTSCSHPSNKIIVTATTATCMDCSTELSLPRSSAQEDCDHPRLGRVIGDWCVCFECGLWVRHATTPVQAEK